MTPERWKRQKDIFGEALARSEADRLPFLEQACAADPELLAEMKRLLEAYNLSEDLPSSAGVFSTAAAPVFQPQQLAAGRFRIIRFVGRGGMGEVYEAEDTVLGQRVALKIIQPAVFGGESIGLLKHEIQSARRVTHPNVCRTYDIAEHADPPLMVLTMEFLEGRTLSRHLREFGPLTREQALPLIEQIAAGLQAAHGAGVVHGDFKAANLMLTGSPDAWRPVITDFGLALFPESQRVGGAGTPGYMAPEQIDGGTPTPQSDVYALGVVIASLLGVAVHRTGLPRTRAELAPLGPWAKIVARCLSADPAQRYQKPADVAQALRRAGRWWPWALTAAAAIGIVVAAVFMQTKQTAQEPLTRRLVCNDCGDWEGDISRDGLRFVFTDWETGDLVIRRLDTGRIERLHFKTGSFNESDSFAEMPRFSPDGSQIAYYWYDEDPSPSYQLRVASSAMSGPARVVLRDSRKVFFEVVGWSGDGRKLLVLITNPDHTADFAWVGMNGEVKRIKSLGWRFYNTSVRARLSDDGHYLLYTALVENPISEPPPANYSKDQHIYLLLADGSQEVDLTPSPGINKNPIWSEDGAHVLFQSDRSGTLDLWSIPVRGGRAQGSPRMVMGNLGGADAFGAGGGRYFLDASRQAESVSVYETGFDGKGQAGRLLDRIVGLAPTYSPDGKRLALKRRIPASPPGSTGGFYLMVHDMETGEERAYTSELGTTGGGRASWFPDGNSVMTGLSHKDGSLGFYRVDLATGGFSLVQPSRAALSELSQDGRVLYLVRPALNSADTQQSIVARDLFDGKERTIYTSPQTGTLSFAMSPDGGNFVVHREPAGQRSVLGIVNIGTGGYREIHSSPWHDLRIGGYPVWSGKHILFSGSQGQYPAWQVMRMPETGGTPQPIGIQNLRPIQNLTVNPDASRIAFSTTGNSSDLWALDNLRLQ